MKNVYMCSFGWEMVDQRSATSAGKKFLARNAGEMEN